MHIWHMCIFPSLKKGISQGPAVSNATCTMYNVHGGTVSGNADSKNSS